MVTKFTDNVSNAEILAKQKAQAAEKAKADAKLAQDKRDAAAKVNPPAATPRTIAGVSVEQKLADQKAAIRRAADERADRVRIGNTGTEDVMVDSRPASNPFASNPPIPREKVWTHGEGRNPNGTDEPTGAEPDQIAKRGKAVA